MVFEEEIKQKEESDLADKAIEMVIAQIMAAGRGKEESMVGDLNPKSGIEKAIY